MYTAWERDAIDVGGKRYVGEYRGASGPDSEKPARASTEFSSTVSFLQIGNSREQHAGAVEDEMVDTYAAL
jgi:hypothetical protein